MDTQLYHPQYSCNSSLIILNKGNSNSLYVSSGDITSQSEQHVAKRRAAVIHKEDPLHVERNELAVINFIETETQEAEMRQTSLE